MTPTAASPIFIAGPTASGKSAVALELANRLVGEIISVDSMQVYRGLDIGTAKPTASERQQIPHHLIDVAELSEAFDAARFVHLAKEAVEQINSRGHVPIFCGGTGLYFKAYLEGLGESPAADPALRAELESIPLSQLLTELEQRDPVAFGRIDRANARRVVRAIEVIRLTGRPYSEQRTGWKTETERDVSLMFFGISRATDDLRQRIDVRVDAMFRTGLAEETRQLLEQGLEQNRTAMQAIGYRQVVEHLRGERSLPETIALVKIRTRQFAKRQMTWFRRQAPVNWIEVRPDDSATMIANGIIGRLD
ncbi:MAG TPA: tRNA (adenosine(37)-N6)-dimethylallyltransferase MiaA [Roseimicrobium sp.]|nr:tRNA (adenosine(37)-N6)-dimethylallyltransferase MiaA [Roseimicrobium sp.]